MCLIRVRAKLCRKARFEDPCSDGIGVSLEDLQAPDGPDRLSGCVCDVLLHTQHTLIQVNIYI